MWTIQETTSHLCLRGLWMPLTSFFDDRFKKYKKKTYLSYSVAKCIHINNSIKCCSRINFVLDIRESAVVIWATSSFVLKSVSFWHNMKFQILSNLTNCITQITITRYENSSSTENLNRSKVNTYFWTPTLYLYSEKWTGPISSHQFKSDLFVRFQFYWKLKSLRTQCFCQFPAGGLKSTSPNICHWNLLFFYHSLSKKNLFYDLFIFHWYSILCDFEKICFFHLKFISRKFT